MEVTNKVAFDLVGVSIEEYERWCIRHLLRSYERGTKKIFFDSIHDGRIKIVDGKIVEQFVEGNDGV